MKNVFFVILLLICGCSQYKTVTNDCNKPTMFVIVYGDNWDDETYPTAISHLEETKKHHEGKIKKIIYFCNDKQIADHLDSKYPLIRFGGMLK